MFAPNSRHAFGGLVAKSMTEIVTRLVTLRQRTVTLVDSGPGRLIRFCHRRRIAA